MKANGIIHVFNPTISNFTTINDDSKWSANNVELVIENSVISITFSWKNSVYNLKGKELKPGYFDCKFQINNEEPGQSFIWIYENLLGLMINGDWEENGESWEIVGMFQKVT
jgi:hypothetical protein